MNKTTFKLLFLFGLFTLTACNKFLDVQPVDKFTETAVYANERSIQQALNGIYNDLASNTLYGANLSSTTVELLGQRYQGNRSSSQYTEYQTYQYDQDRLLNTFNGIWSSAYSRILELNIFINGLSNSGLVLGEGYSNLLLGEAYGLRALLHFDLLRLFGPVYNTADSLSASIPYNTLTSGLAAPILAASAVMDSIQHDLKSAATLLENDPIRTLGIQDSALSDGYDFYRYRNRRMNYFAVRALQARVHLYRKENVQANAAAKEILQQVESKFPWLPYSAIAGVTLTSPDRIFSTEVLFGLINGNMYSSVQATYFAASVIDSHILAPFGSRLDATYENNANDYRFTISNTWRQVDTKSFRTFFKYSDVSDATMKFRNFQPLIRKSELYYILAETEPDPAMAVSYLNTVRYNRGLANLDATVNLNDEIKKEYQKEFFGEGQVFFYYKRLNAATIPDANSIGNISMDAAKYVVPLPLSETDYR